MNTLAALRIAKLRAGVSRLATFLKSDGPTTGSVHVPTAMGGYGKPKKKPKPGEASAAELQKLSDGVAALHDRADAMLGKAGGKGGGKFDPAKHPHGLHGWFTNTPDKPKPKPKRTPPTDPAEMHDATKTAVFGRGKHVDGETLNGVKLEPWRDHPTTRDGWAEVDGQKDDLDEPPFRPAAKKKIGAGVIVREPDGRVWIVEPKDHFGGYKATFPKGTLEPGHSLQATAIKEAFEESGLKVEITGFAGDYERTTSKARYYYARRVGGSPTDHGPESMSVQLVPAKDLAGRLNMDVDKKIAADIQVAKMARDAALLRASAAALVLKAGVGSKFSEALHPRGPGGKFRSKPGQQKPHGKHPHAAVPPSAADVTAKWTSAGAKSKKAKVAAIEAMGKNGDLAGLKALQLGSKAGGLATKLHAYHAAWVAHLEAKAGETGAAAPKATLKLSELKNVGGQKGSNPGGVYQDAHGQKYYVKQVKSNDHAANELLAAHLYNALGVKTFDYVDVELPNGQKGVATKFVDGVDKFDPSNPAHLADAQKHFAAHAFLANWDAAGLSFDNQGFVGGQITTLDTGGSLLFRAQGTPKGAAFGTKVAEWASLRDPTKNPQAAAIFGKMTASQLVDSTQAVAALPDARIVALVKKYGPGDDTAKAALAAKLIARKADIVKQGELLQPKPAPAPRAPKPTAAPVPSASLTPPTYAGKKTEFWSKSTQEIEALHAAGDLAGLKAHKYAGKLQQEAAGGPLGTANKQKFLAYHQALVADLEGKQAAAAAAKPPAATPKPAPASAAPARIGKPALPDFDQHKVPASNSNAPSHNAKVDAIAAAAKAGDANAILAMSYATNTYGKKQAQLANDALAALGSPHQVKAGQLKKSHPALTGQHVPPAAPAPKPAAKPASAKPSPKAVTAADLPDKHNFANWNGQGKGLSSKPGVNESNAKAENKIERLALAGDLAGLKAATFPVLDANGQPTGEQKSFAQHPSKHVQQYYGDAIATVEDALNPAEPLRTFSATKAASLDAISQLAKALPPGTVVSQLPKNKQFGFWAALGQVQDPAKFMPPKVGDLTSADIANGKTAYQSYSSQTKGFVKAMQGSGAFASAYRNGEKTYGAIDLAKANKAAHQDATALEHGKALYRWQNMPASMLKQLEKAPEGVIFQATGPMPTSYHPTGTSGFGKHRVKIVAAPGAKALMSYGSGAFQGEREVTTLPNARFVLLKKEQVPDTEHNSPNTKRWELTVMMLPPDPGAAG